MRKLILIIAALLAVAVPAATASPTASPTARPVAAQKVYTVAYKKGQIVVVIGGKNYARVMAAGRAFNSGLGGHRFYGRFGQMRAAYANHAAPGIVLAIFTRDAAYGRQFVKLFTPIAAKLGWYRI